MPSQSPATSPVCKVPASKITIQTERQLYARSAGRCEFAGCNRFLLEHHVKLTPANFAKKAHVVAYKRGGPRGDHTEDRANINDLSNLMLLCQACHDLIDGDPQAYSVDTLRAFKKAHEDRVHDFTALQPESTTRLLRVTGMVRSQSTVIPDDAVVSALGAKPFDPRIAGFVDLNLLDDDGPGYWTTAEHQLALKVNGFLDSASVQTSFQTISVFAIARIPLLVKLGSLLSSKVPAKVFNRHVDTEDWAWKQGSPSNFSYRWLNKARSSDVVILVSLSGDIQRERLPSELHSIGSVIEMSVEGGSSRTCLSTEKSVEKFRDCYLSALSEIRRLGPRNIHLVPAIPTAGAVYLGRDILPKFDPPIKIYDWDGSYAYTYSMTVNDHD